MGKVMIARGQVKSDEIAAQVLYNCAAGNHNYAKRIITHNLPQAIITYYGVMIWFKKIMAR